MSVDQSIYLGPYLLVGKLTKSVTYKEIQCGNKICKKYQKETKSKFCSECGKETITVEKSKIEKVYARHLLEDDFIDSLFEASSCGSEIVKNKEVLIPNHKLKNVKELKVPE